MVNEKLIKYKEKIQAYVREGTSDEFVVKEVFSGEYNKLDIQPDDVIVDFGLNIGMFTCFALSKGAKKVWSYEAEEENYNLAVRNVQLNFPDQSRYDLNNKAVVGNQDAIRYFSINTKKNKGAHSLVEKRGRDRTTVHCININDVIAQANPTIIKMDIEGAEYECLPAVQDWSGVRELIFEFHHAHLNDIKTHDKYEEILKLVRQHFPNVTARQDTKAAWVNIVYCRK
jgi:FkbM family methyltransferase